MLSNEQQESPQAPGIEVVVSEVIGDRELQYAVSYTTKNDVLPKGTPITFSIRYWESDMLPQKGQVAILQRIQKFAKGWRAFEAKPVLPETRSKHEAEVGCE
jgi:hypothetical protein